MLSPTLYDREWQDAESGEAGFTLIEAIVTLAILALALSTLVSVLSDGFRRAGQAEVVAQANLHARSLLDKVGAEIPLTPGLTTGQLANGSHWQLHIEPFGDGADQRAWPVGAYTILAEVSWREGMRDRSIMVSTLRLGPKERFR